MGPISPYVFFCPFGICLLDLSTLICMFDSQMLSCIKCFKSCTDSTTLEALPRTGSQQMCCRYPRKNGTEIIATIGPYVSFICTLKVNGA